MTAVQVWSADRIRTYARLAKLDVFDYYIGLLVVLTLLAPAVRFDVRTLAVLTVFLLGEVFVIAAMVALDDLTGYRDGSDVANYGPDAPARKKARKPLVAGTLTESEVSRFALVAAVAGGLLWTVAALIAPYNPGWTIAVIVVTFVISVQYSWGVKLSYHGFQELFLAALGWALVLAPYGLVAGSASGFVIVEAVLFGLGPLLFGVYSNTNDIPGDRSVGRPTVASLVSPRGNALFIAGLSIAEGILIVDAPFAGAPWYFAVILLPTIVLRVRQYVLGFRCHDILRARKLGIRIHRLTTVLLITVNVLHGGAG